MLSLAGALLAAVTLVSLLVNAIAGWWWTDGMAAVLIAAFMLREGGRTLRAATATEHARAVVADCGPSPD